MAEKKEAQRKEKKDEYLAGIPSQQFGSPWLR